MIEFLVVGIAMLCNERYYIKFVFWGKDNFYVGPKFVREVRFQKRERKKVKLERNIIKKK